MTARPPTESTPCIEVYLGRDDQFQMTVSEYDEVQRQRYDQPLWARRMPPVEALSLAPSAGGWNARITDLATYDAQMRQLLGLDE